MHKRDITDTKQVVIQPMQIRKPALFLDRDGVINHEVGYLHRPEDVLYVPGVVPLIQTARELGYHIVVITNQAGIGRGYYTEDDFLRLMKHMCAELRSQQASIDAIYFCPDHPEHGIGKYKRESPLRKPAPGMLLQAAQEHNLDLANSILVGDRCSDIAAGAAAGLTRLYLLSGTESGPCTGEYRTVNSLHIIMNELRHSSAPLVSLPEEGERTLT